MITFPRLLFHYLLQHGNNCRHECQDGKKRDYSKNNEQSDQKVLAVLLAHSDPCIIVKFVAVVHVVDKHFCFLCLLLFFCCFVVI